MSLRLDSVQEAISAIAAGRAVVVVDDEDRENEGDIIFAADAATTELMAFTIRHSSGVICVPVERERLDALDIALMTPQNQDPLRTAYTVSVDAAQGVSTGISAHDRALTARLLASGEAVPGDFTRPGHVFPLQYRAGGVLVRRGHTEAAVDLARLAGRAPVGVLVEIVNDDGSMKRGHALREFADEHGLPLISIEALVAHRQRTESSVERQAVAELPTQFGNFRVHGYRSRLNAAEHVALVKGDVSVHAVASHDAVLVRVHSECLTGDTFASVRCDCGPQLEESMRRVEAAGVGVVVHLAGHEGRGIGLVEKLRAYALQDTGVDTVDANRLLGHGDDSRTYEVAAHVLRDLGIARVRLLSNNPRKAQALEALGIEVVSVEALVPPPASESIAYLRAKRDRMGHVLDHPSLHEESA